MGHLNQNQYTEIAQAYEEAQINDELPEDERSTTSPDHVDSVINLFYDPSDYWQWHPDTLLVDAIEDVIGYGIDELVGVNEHEEYIG